MGETTRPEEASAPPTPGYDYERGADGTWWARDQKTGELHWHDATTGRWLRYQAPPARLQVPVLPYARFWERFLAFLVDSTLTGGVGYAAGWALGSVALDADATGEEVGNLFLLVQGIGIFIGWMYYGLMESSSLQATIGKKLVGLQVTDLAGKRVGFGRATGRHFAKFLSAAIVGMGFLMVAWDDKKQGLHDHAAGTLILKRGLNTLRPHIPEPEPPQVHPA